MYPNSERTKASVSFAGKRLMKLHWPFGISEGAFSDTVWPAFKLVFTQLSCLSTAEDRYRPAWCVTGLGVSTFARVFWCRVNVLWLHIKLSLLLHRSGFRASVCGGLCRKASVSSSYYCRVYETDESRFAFGQLAIRVTAKPLVCTWF